MNNLTGTQTEQNLRFAFSGESEARNKYTFFAKVAKQEGYEQIAAIFEETALTRREQEIPHFYKEGTEKVDNTVYIWYNVSIKYRRCFYDRTTAEIGTKSIHGNI